ncbi:MAG: cation:proton antiporter [Candidatus Hodarchaeales archaeon]|jgi:Kef-type K+ transport system membrane component KefB
MSDIDLFIVQLGLILVLGFVGAHLLKKYGIPQVLGFILSGMALGILNDTFTFISIDLVALMSPLVTLALGFIGFNIGAELSWDELKKVDKKIFAILIADSIGTFLITSILVFLFTDLSLNFALILGALASATAPAATADVLWEYKSSGPLTQAVLFILAVDDIISIFLVQITTNITKSQIMGMEIELFHVLGSFLQEVGVALILGVISGVIIVWAINRVKDHGEILEMILGSLILVIGVSILFESSSIFAAMIFGIIIASLSKEDPFEVFHDIFKIGSPIVATFFIVVGLAMNLVDLLLIGGLGAVYLIGRTLGKVGAVSVTARVVSAPDEIRRYLGLCLFSQAGVALGLAAQIYSDFQGTPAAVEAGLILTTITGTIVIVQLIGPLLVKWAIHRAGEVGGTIEQLRVAEGLFATEEVEQLRTNLQTAIMGIYGGHSDFIKSEEAIKAIDNIIEQYSKKKQEKNSEK